MTNAEQQLRATTNLLARSQVAVYPIIDALGLLGLPGYKGENYNNLIGASATLTNDSNFLYQIDDEHSTLTRMAQDTGRNNFVANSRFRHDKVVILMSA